MAGTHEDAVLMVELAKWGAMIGLDEASRAIFADDFDPDAVEANDPSVQAMLLFGETVGTLVKNGLLDRDLVYDWLWVSGSWERSHRPRSGAREDRRPAAVRELRSARSSASRPGCDRAPVRPEQVMQV